MKREMINLKNKYLTIFESLPNPVILLDGNNRIDIMNNSAAELFNQSGTPGLCHYGECPGSESIMAWLSDRLIPFIGSEHSHLSYETTLETPEGVRNFEVKFTRMLDISGKFDGIVVILNEITERKKAEEVLIKSRDFYFSLFEDFPALIWRSGTDSRCDYLNNTWLAFTGRRLDQDMGEGWVDCVHPDDRERCMNTYLTAFADHKSFKVEYRLRRHDGVYRWMMDFGKPFHNMDGSFAGYIGSGYDITERKKAEETLRESEEKYRTLFNNANDAIFLHGFNNGMPGQFIEVNDVACQRLGYSREELLSMSPGDIDDDHDADKVSGIANNIIEKGHYTFEVGHVAKSGRIIPVEVNSHLFNLNGQQVILSISRDFTDRKRAEESLRITYQELEAANRDLRSAEEELKQQFGELMEAKEAAEAANRAKGEFLAKMSHEIRTPMNSIIGMTELLMETPLNREQMDLSGIVLDSANLLLNIINDILDFSKIEAGKMKMEKIGLNPAQVLESVSEVMSLKAREKKLALKTFIDPGLPGLLLGDPGRLRQVLLNLTSNAVKFTQRGEVALSVHIESEETNTVTLRFEVRDTGIGISEKDCGKIFNPFVQADGSTTRKYGGTGLGLSISKQLVELMGGRIGVDSRLDRGSVFWFTAVLEKRSSAGGNSVLEEWRDHAVAPNLRRYKGGSFFPATTRNAGGLILLAEDNPVNRKLVLHQLEKIGYSAHSVTNGQEAVEAVFSGHPYQLILMDCQMPLMDGFEATRVIRQRELPLGRRIPIIAITAHAMEGIQEQCRESGMDDYLCKPVQLEKLRKVLELKMPPGQGFPAGLHLPDTVGDSIDIGVLKVIWDLQGNNSELVEQLIEIYLADTPLQMASLREAVEKGDMSGVSFIAHSIKSSSMNMGARIFSSMAGELEKTGRSGDIAGAVEKLAIMEGEYPKVVSALETVRFPMK